MTGKQRITTRHFPEKTFLPLLLLSFLDTDTLPTLSGCLRDEVPFWKLQGAVSSVHPLGDTRLVSQLDGAIEGKER